jgi:biotin transport system substrate-specific component
MFFYTIWDGEVVNNRSIDNETINDVIKKDETMKDGRGTSVKIRDMILISLFAAMTAVGAFINIPTPSVPFSLQFVFSAYSGVLLGSKRGLLSQLLYIGIGLTGIPVFTRGGGLSYVLQPSFGFLLGFAAGSFVIGLFTERMKGPTMPKLLVAVLAGLACTYLIGVPYLYFIINVLAEAGKKISFQTAIAWGFTPFVLFDLIKAVIVALSGTIVLPILRKHGF